jgi:hypothetical protein
MCILLKLRRSTTKRDFTRFARPNGDLRGNRVKSQSPKCTICSDPAAEPRPQAAGRRCTVGKYFLRYQQTGLPSNMPRRQFSTDFARDWTRQPRKSGHEGWAQAPKRSGEHRAAAGRDVPRQDRRATQCENSGQNCRAVRPEKPPSRPCVPVQFSKEALQ